MMKEHVPLSMDMLCYTVLLLVASKIFYKIAVFFLAPYTSSLKTIPGPPSKHWYYGWVTPDVMSNLTQEIVRKHQEFGPVFYANLVQRVPTLFLSDEQAISYIYQNEYTPTKPGFESFTRVSFVLRVLTTIYGSTVLGTEGEVHRRQRKAMMPAFTESSIHRATSIMYEVANTLTDVLHKDIEGKETNEEGFVQLIISDYTTDVAMDMIGNAGFGQDLGSLKKRATMLTDYFRNLNQLLFTPNAYLMIRYAFPWITRLTKYFVEQEKQLKKYQGGIRDCADNLVNIAEKEAKEQSANEDRNVLRLVKRASLSDQKTTISDVELSESVPILLLAGYDTTATALTWIFHELTCDQNGLEKQSRLRTELKAEENREWQNDFTILNKLPYLDAVCSELMRLRPSFASTSRICCKDIIVPFGSPVRLRDGTATNQIKIKKGEAVYISIQTLNTSEKLWGQDAKRFIPERWLREGHQYFDAKASHSMGKAHQTVGGWNHTMSFGQGIRMCLGFRFALAEFKIVLAHCIDQFEWQAAINPNTGDQFTIEPHGQLVCRAAIKDESKIDRYSLPILVKPIQKEIQ